VKSCRALNTTKFAQPLRLEVAWQKQEGYGQDMVVAALLGHLPYFLDDLESGSAQYAVLPQLSTIKADAQQMILPCMCSLCFIMSLCCNHGWGP
jgi:hypothetical protein